MSERRYTDEEVAEILDRATETTTGSGGGGPASGGMTLAELQDIGEEVGIPKEVMARAAASLDRAAPVPATERTFMGAPIGVGCSVDLPRRLTEDEWNRLVVDLRMTFDAKGKIRHECDFRQWTNGNLQALLEPTGAGACLRLKTVKGTAIPYMTTGSVLLGFWALALITSFLGGGPASGSITVGVMGAAFFVAGRFGLRKWARVRRRQMEEIITRLREAVTLPPPALPDGPEGTRQPNAPPDGSDTTPRPPTLPGGWEESRG